MYKFVISEIIGKCDEFSKGCFDEEMVVYDGSCS